MPVPETVVVAVYCMVDDFLKAEVPPDRRRRGRRSALARSEVLTLALVAQLGSFPSERAFWRRADAEWRHRFPRLPSRPQLNRAIRAEHAALAAFGRACARRPRRADGPVRGARHHRRAAAVRQAPGGGDHAGGGRAGVVAAAGLVRRRPAGGRRDPDRRRDGLGVRPRQRPGPCPGRRAAGPARPPGADVAERRRCRAPGAASGLSLADTGFAGRDARARWLDLGADVLAPPQPGSGEVWPAAVRSLHRSRRQIVETVFARLHGAFRLERDRPRSLGGLWARIAAKVALSNALIRLNRDDGRPGLTLAGVVL